MIRILILSYALESLRKRNVYVRVCKLKPIEFYAVLNIFSIINFTSSRPVLRTGLMSLGCLPVVPLG